MNRTLRSLLNLGFVVTVTAGLVGTAVADPAKPRLTITLSVYNYAEIPHDTLLQAEEEAAKIFGKVGAETQWLDVSIAVEQEQITSVSRQTSGSANFQLSVFILPRFMEEGWGLPKTALGFALANSRRAYVFSNRVEGLARPCRCGNRAQILGHAMAHEIGHVLLGSNSHSSKGIMRPDWKRKDLQRAATGRLLFTSQQTKIIWTRVSRQVR